MSSPTLVVQVISPKERELQKNEDNARAKQTVHNQQVILNIPNNQSDVTEEPMLIPACVNAEKKTVKKAAKKEVAEGNPMPSTLAIQKTDESDQDVMEKLLVPQKEEEAEEPLVMPKVEKK